MSLPVITIVFQPGQIAPNLLVSHTASQDPEMNGFYWREVEIEGNPFLSDTFQRSFGPFEDLKDCHRHYSNLYKSMRRKPATWPIHTDNVIEFKRVAK